MHNFIDIDKTPHITDFLHKTIPIAIKENSIKKCTNCDLICIDFSERNDNLEYFLLNDDEVFHDCYNLSEVNLTCEEIIIKNIIE